MLAGTKIRKKIVLFCLSSQAPLQRDSVCVCSGYKRPRAVDLKQVRQMMERTI